MRHVTVPVGRHGFASRPAQVSLRCDDCGRLRFSTRLELRRAARLRCRHCGGLLHESQTQAARDERLTRTRFGAYPVLSDDEGSKPHACPCGARFRSPVALKLHREERHDAARTPEEATP
jgi:DNA-directed RNA polymerase subunit RPC12/RpoP